MMTELTELRQNVRHLQDAIGTWNPQDGGNIGAFVPLFKALVEHTPDTIEELRVLWRLGLEVLETFPEAVPEERSRRIESVIGALAAGEQYLVAENNSQRSLPVKEAGRNVLRILGHDSEEWEALVSLERNLKGQAGGLSLDDAAALLIQLGPTDSAEMTRIRDFLREMSDSEQGGAGYSESVRKSSAEAAKKLDRVIQGKTSNPDNDLTEVGWLLEGAIESKSESENNFPGTPQSTSGSETKPEEIPSALLLPPQDADLDLIVEFITECREYIENAEAALLELEMNPQEMGAVNTVFRAFHRIKGTAAFLGLTILAELAHHAESLLSRMRDGEIQCTGGYANLALRSVDMLKELVQWLQDALGGSPQETPSGLSELMHVLSDPEGVGVSEDDLTAPPPRLGDLLVAEGSVTREDVETAAAVQGQESLGIALTRSGSASVETVAKALRTQRRMAGFEHTVDSSVRVRTDRLDRLIDMVGELVIAHAMVAQDAIVLPGGHHDFLKKISHSGKITRELQDLTMSMRMVSFKATFQKMARVVRDVAQKGNKLVNFTTEGEDTEIDRNMVDVISDPLIHMVRNAVDHGIESPEEREQRNKPSIGMVKVSAYHAGGNVVVALQDDGRGLNRDELVEKGISRGLIESGKNMSDSDVFNLLFEPGFSTAEQVTDVSGRGVGMDVVKRSLEALNGRVDITSELGNGTTFSVRLPLTLAITDGMLVKVGCERYIIPTIDIYVSFRPQRESLFTVTGRGELVTLRGELIPLVRLHNLFNVPDAIEEPTQGLLVVVNDGERHYGLLVDELLGQQQVVVKSLGTGIGDVPGISGAAILGDGRVGLILDPSGVVALARQTPTPSSSRKTQAGAIQRQQPDT